MTDKENELKAIIDLDESIDKLCKTRNEMMDDFIEKHNIWKKGDKMIVMPRFNRKEEHVVVDSVKMKINKGKPVFTIIVWPWTKGWKKQQMSRNAITIFETNEIIEHIPQS